MSEPTTLGDEYPKQQARCRELLRQYAKVQELGGAGVFTGFAVANIEAVLREADRAAVEGDTVAMLRAFAAMKECA